MSTPASLTGIIGSQTTGSAAGKVATDTLMGASPNPFAPAQPFGPQKSTSGWSVAVHHNTANLQDEINSFYTWDSNQLNEFRAQMGLLNSNYLTAPNVDAGGANSLLSAWTNLVNTAYQYNQKGIQYTPWDILASNVAATGGLGGKGKSTTKTTTETDLTNRVDAQAIFYQSAQQLLGRAPTDSEVASFQGYLNSKEKANPTVRTIQTDYDPSGNIVGQNTTKSSGGVSDAAKQLAGIQEAQKNPEYGAYQAATTYMNALKSAIGG